MINENGMIVCPFCDGEGEVDSGYDDEDIGNDFIEICNICKGKGYITWIENLLNKEEYDKWR